jgi:ESF2/ABP1 family protein
MKPNKVRTMFEQYGEVTRLYLAEEDISVRLKRKEKGGNASKQFKEGWIEFADKSIAKSVAESLNNARIENKKGSFYYDDLWNLKYLKNFKWEYLTEKLSYERRVRESKLNLAMIHSKRSNAEVVELMEKTKVHNIVQERKRKRGTVVQDGEEKSVDKLPKHSSYSFALDSAANGQPLRESRLGKHKNLDNRIDVTLMRSVLQKND